VVFGRSWTLAWRVEIRDLTDAIIRDQEREIRQMLEWRAAWTR
jgi:uncharacterized protein (DUF305 family)